MNIAILIPFNKFKELYNNSTIAIQYKSEKEIREDYRDYSNDQSFYFPMIAMSNSWKRLYKSIQAEEHKIKSSLIKMASEL